MKIAVFSRYPNDSQYPKGGVESVTVVLVKALASMDDLDVHVITLERDRIKPCVEQDDDVTVHRVSASNWPQMLDIYIGPGKQRLTKYMIDLKPDVVHIHETYGLTLGNFPIPHVFTIHGFDHANLIADSAKHAWIRSRLWRYVERRGLSKQKHIISINPYVRTMIEPLTDANIYDINNPVDERFFKIERRPEAARILCTGWINARKNTLGSVEAFARLATRYPQARLILAGQAKEAEYFDRVKQSIEQHGIGDVVEILGHVNHVQLKDELARASVFLLPSKQENAPMAIAEAMAAGIPVITSNRCGMPYMVKEGKTGFLIDPESVEQIADRLDKLLSSLQLCHEMGLAGHDLAMERFHPRVVTEKTREVYRKIYDT